MIRHFTINIAGILKRKSSLGKLFEDENGKFLNNRQARKMLTQMLAEGKRLFPIGDCEGFDYQTGCPGHPSEKDILAEEDDTIDFGLHGDGCIDEDFDDECEQNNPNDSRNL